MDETAPKTDARSTRAPRHARRSWLIPAPLSDRASLRGRATVRASEATSGSGQ